MVWETLRTESFTFISSHTNPQMGFLKGSYGKWLAHYNHPTHKYLLNIYHRLSQEYPHMYNYSDQPLSVADTDIYILERRKVELSEVICLRSQSMQVVLNRVQSQLAEGCLIVITAPWEGTKHHSTTLIKIMKGNLTRWIQIPFLPLTNHVSSNKLLTSLCLSFFNL